MGEIAIGPTGASAFVEKSANWVVLELAVSRSPKTLAFQVEFANLLGTAFPIRRLGLRTWRSLSFAFGFSFHPVLSFALCEEAVAVGLLVAVLAAVAALALELGSFAFLFTFTASLSGGSNRQGAAARQVLGHLGAGPFKTASLKEFSNNPHVDSGDREGRPVQMPG